MKSLNVSEKKKDFICLGVGLFLLANVLFFFILTFVAYFDSGTDVFLQSEVWYLLATIALVLAIVIACLIYEHKTSAKTKNKVAIVAIGVALIVVIILGANIESGDYTAFLKLWCEAYSDCSISDALKKITEVSNYTPFYNYFLIAIAGLKINFLYGIKFVSFVFAILLALVQEKIIISVKGSKFSAIRFCAFLLLPASLYEFAIWAQCDMIYTFFALSSFYFALNKKSKLSMLFVGLAFAIKMQFLFIVPILFIMLLVKDESGEHYLKWKDIWIAPLMYVVNFLPALAGANFLDLCLVYFGQTSTDYGLSGNCANISNVFRLLIGNASILKFLTYFQIVVTFVVLILLIVLILKMAKKNNMVLSKETLVKYAVIFSFSMVFFMPKMLERFYFIPVSLSVCLAFICRENIYKYLAYFANSALFFMMMIFMLYYYTYMFFITYTSMLGMIGGFLAMALIARLVHCDYKNLVVKNKKNGKEAES